jgi:electron transfer flavoprotein alpha subunit
VRELLLDGDVLNLGCEHDDSWLELEVRLPAVVSCAERLCGPAKVPPEGRAAVPASLVTRLTADDLGPGPWGAAGSLTTVGACREAAVSRLRRRSPEAPLATQVKETVRFLLDRDALGEEAAARRPDPVPLTGGPGPVVTVVAEPGDDALARELCGLAARLAAAVGGSTVLITPGDIPARRAGSWGADLVVRVSGWAAEEDIARAVTAWAASVQPWGFLVGSTAYGREVAARVAAALGAGLTGDAIDLEVADGRLVAWKPAFGGQLVAAVTATTPVQLVTIRPGVIPLAPPRARTAEVARVRIEPRSRLVVRTRRREDALEGLGGARVVIGVGAGVAPDEMGQLDELRELLGAELGCTRKLTDAGRLPHARQIGITGRSVAPSLYIAIGMSGKFNHMAGVQAAGTVIAVNSDPDAPVWQFSDLGVVGRWQDCVPLLVAALREA